MTPNKKGIAVAIVLILIAIVWFGVFRPFAPVEVAAPEPATEPAQEDAAVAVVPENAPDEAAETETAEAEAEVAPEERDVGRSEAEFDIVRVEADGETLVAGRAAPGSSVKVMMDGKEVGLAEADGGGNFVALLSLGASEGPRVMSLVEVDKSGVERTANASVILAPSPKVEPAAEDTVVAETGGVADGSETEAEVVAETSEPVAEEPTTVAEAEDVQVPDDDAATEEVVSAEGVSDTAADAVDAGEGVSVAEADAVVPEAETQVAENAAPEAETEASDAEFVATETETDAAAPTVLLADSDGVRVLQTGGDGPEVAENVSIDAISYDSAGEVSLTGRSTGATSVRVYLDNRPILDVDATTGGQWRADLPDIDTGTYTLRVDEIDESGTVVSRAETPFRREPVAAIQALDAGATDLSPVALITVQPGNTLWGIANEKYGDGVLYVRVFQANADRIRNPDLIYPGQIFTVPN